MRNLPLRYRLPNPPPVYEGRADEERWLEERLIRDPLVAVVGDGGIGKTAFVLHVLSRIPREERQVVYVDVRPADPAEDVRMEVARALVAGQRMEGLDWRSLSGDTEALGAVVADLAETGPWTVVVDDAQNATDESVRGLVRSIQRHGRNARWVLLSRRMPPSVDVGSRSLVLEGMREDDLERLARVCAPRLEPARIGGAIAASAGSPWRLLQALAAPPSGGEGEPRSPLDELDDATRRTLREMSVLQVPVRADVLSGYLGSIDIEGLAAIELDEDMLSVLEQRGLLDRVGEGFRLHDVVRDELAPLPEGEARQLAARVAPLLEGDEDTAAALEAVRLHLDVGDLDSARRMLVERGDELIGAGYAHRLWRMIGDADHPDLQHWRLRCAVELGDPHILQSVAEPEEGGAAARLLWARALFAQGRLDEAVEAGAEATRAASLEHDPEAIFDAGFLHARALANLSRWDESIAAFDALEPRSVDGRVRRDVVVARCLLLRGDGAQALERIRDVRPSMGELSPQVRVEMCYAMADLLHELGRTDEAMEMLERVDREAHGMSPLLYSQWGRRSLYQRATLALSRGALDEAREVLASLWPFMGPASLLRPHLKLADAIVRFAGGELEGVRDAFREVRAEGERRRSDGLYCVASVYLRRLHILRNEPFTDVDDPDLLLGRETLFGGLLALYEMQGRLRAGEALAPDVFEGFRARTDLPELRVAAHAVACEAALLSGDPGEGLRLAEIGMEEARRGRLGVAVAEASVARCAALAVLGRRTELERAAREIASRARAMPSTRFAVEARFFEHVAREDTDEIFRFVGVATRAGGSPAAARRAAGVLGSDVALDALDHAIVDALRDRQPWSRVTRVDAERAGDGAGWRAAWGLDESRQQVWLPGGETVDLAPRPLLWRLLAVLSARGAATKEELVLGAWDVREYHPLRHDNRLQVAMRKLRRAIETDPSHPERVVTTDDGYALVGPVMWEQPPPRLSDLPPRRSEPPRPPG